MQAVAQTKYEVIEIEVFSGPYLSVVCNHEEIGRILVVGRSFHARHTCRHVGGVFQSRREAIEYVVGIDLAIEAEFAGQLTIAA